MVQGRWFKRFMVGVLSLAVAVLVAALAVLGLLVGASNDRERGARLALQEQATTNERLILELKGLVEAGQNRDAERSAIIDEAIARILAELRLSADCLYIAGRYNEHPAPCKDVAARVAELRRGESILPKPVVPTTTTTAPRPPVPPVLPPTTLPPPPTTTTTSTPCRVGLLGLCIL